MLSQEKLNQIVDQALVIIDSCPEIKERMLREIKLDIIDKMYSSSRLNEIPGPEITGILRRVRLKGKKKALEEFEIFLKLYLLGKMDGIRSERAKKMSRVS